jgi:GT2 family glycosyltransferase
MQIDLSFILVNWNTKALILEALCSIFDTVYDYAFEINVVDNGSEDGSPETIRDVFPTVHLILNKENLGFARATNQALVQSGGRYVFLMNSDVRLKERAVQVLVRYMDDNPNVGIAAGQLVNKDGSKQNTIAPFPTLATELLSKRLLRILSPRRYPGKERNYSSPIDVDSLVGACIVVRRKAIEEVGGLDERYFFFMEETDWCLRMKNKGWRICFVPQAHVLHLQGASAAMAKIEAKIEFYRSRYLFFTKYRGRLRTHLLKIGLMVRIVGGMTVDFFFSRVNKRKRKYRTYWRLLMWHLKSCPSNEGLREVKYVKASHQKN